MSGPRRNRVDPFGDLHAVPERGMFTGNRGCLVDDSGRLVRHHRGQLWITCVTSFRGWKSPLDRPHHWTPLFFLDDAVAMAAGHRPCGLCRRDDYLSYRGAVQEGMGWDRPPAATELNKMLARERLRRGRGMSRASDRKTWDRDIVGLPDGAVLVADEGTALVRRDKLFLFEFSGWKLLGDRPRDRTVRVITPPTSVAALAHGYVPSLHPSADV